VGILPQPACFVMDLKLPAGFSVCELGDQWMSGLKKPLLAAEWYRTLGCGRYESIDGNGKGTLTADLNLPLAFHVPKYKDAFYRAFDLVTDFGTSEHVFHQAQVWETLHDLTKPGGYLVIDRPSDGYPGHCYYRVDRCLLEDVARVNRYEVIRLETAKTPRGALVRAVYRTPAKAAPFVIPQQGRYLDTLVIQ
jgi:SAM-dependent methyltransferase